MRIVNISPHFFVKGGSDSYFLAQSEALEAYGMEVVPFCTASCRDLPSRWSRYFAPAKDWSKPKLRDVAEFVYSLSARRKLRALLAATKIDIAHLHIYYGNFSGSILSVLKDEYKVPIVQTLHDYKLVCPVYSLTQQGRVCEACKGHQFWRALPRRCNRGSFGRTLISVIESYVSRICGSVSKIDRFVAVSNFQAERLRNLGVPGSKLRVIHNFIDTKRVTPRAAVPQNRRFLYFGRMERTKGVFDIIEAAKRLPEYEFVLAGSGTAESEIRGAVRVAQLRNVRIVGFVENSGLHDLIRSSTATILVPTVYENCPMSVLESLALSVPVVGSRMGGIPELIADGTDGLLVEPGCVESLVESLRKLAESEELAWRMGAAGRQKVKERFAPEQHAEALMEVYRELGVDIR